MIQLYATSCSAGLHIVPVVSWEGAPNQLPIFNHTVFTSSFTNHMFRVGLHVTFGINNRRGILAGQPKVLVKPSS